jgi:hypothetical protein
MPIRRNASIGYLVEELGREAPRAGAAPRDYRGAKRLGLMPGRIFRKHIQ